MIGNYVCQDPRAQTNTHVRHTHTGAHINTRPRIHVHMNMYIYIQVIIRSTALVPQDVLRKPLLLFSSLMGAASPLPHPGLVNNEELIFSVNNEELIFSGHVTFGS